MGPVAPVLVEVDRVPGFPDGPQLAVQRIDIDERARGEPLQAVREHVVEDLGLAPGQDRLPGARGVQRRHQAQWVVRAHHLAALQLLDDRDAPVVAHRQVDVLVGALQQLLHDRQGPLARAHPAAPAGQRQQFGGLHPTPRPTRFLLHPAHLVQGQQGALDRAPRPGRWSCRTARDTASSSRSGCGRRTARRELLIVRVSQAPSRLRKTSHVLLGYPVRFSHRDSWQLALSYHSVDRHLRHADQCRDLGHGQ
jgi:hypothetical protein